MKSAIFRKLFIFLLIFLLASFPISAESTSQQTNKKEISLSKVDSYIQTYTYNGFLPTTNSLETTGNIGLFQIDVPRDVYLDEENNHYQFSDGELVLFESYKYLNFPDAENTASTSNFVSENTALQNISASPVICEFVPDFSSFDAVSIGLNDPSTSYGGYTIDFEKTVTEELSDFITVRMDNTGTILWISVGRCGLEEITQEQKDDLWKQVELYADSMDTYFDFFECENIYYQKIGDRILGNYTLRFLQNTQNGEPETVYFGGVIVTIPV